jgi:hypothetical protein
VSSESSLEFLPRHFTISGEHSTEVVPPSPSRAAKLLRGEASLGFIRAVSREEGKLGLNDAEPHVGVQWILCLGEQGWLSAFRPRGVPGPTSKLSLRVPAQMGRCKMEHKGGENRGSCYPAPRADALAVGGYKRSQGRERERERERESLFVSPSSCATTLSSEGPGPSFYRRKERVQVYNGGVAIC